MFTHPIKDMVKLGVTKKHLMEPTEDEERYLEKVRQFLRTFLAIARKQRAAA